MATARSVSGPSAAEETMDDPLLLNQTDIWVNNIFPFLGIGNFFFLAQVNRRWKELHQLFFDTIEEPPMVLHLDGYYVQRWLQNKQPARACCTFYGVAFSTLSYAKHWDASTSGCTDRLPDDAVCALVAARGNIQVLQWAREEKGYPWDFKTCNSAVENGQLEVLKYAHENGCPWDEDTCQCAALNGHLEVLQYAHENGCPWDENTCVAAEENDHFEVLQYALQNGCPED